MQAVGQVSVDSVNSADLVPPQIDFKVQDYRVGSKQNCNQQQSETFSHLRQVRRSSSTFTKQVVSSSYPHSLTMLPRDYFSRSGSSRHGGGSSSSNPYSYTSSSRTSNPYGVDHEMHSSRSRRSSRDACGSSRDPYSRTPYDLHGIGLYSSSSSSSRNPMPHLTERLHEPRAGSFSRNRGEPRASTSSDRRAFDDPYYIGAGYGPSPSPRQSPYEPVRRRSNSEARQYLPNRNPSYFGVQQPFRDLYSSNSGQREYYSGTGSSSSYQVGGYTATRPSTSHRPWR